MPGVPSNCIGMQYFTQCGEYTGPDIPSLDIQTGDNLDYIIAQLSNINGQQSATQTSEITSDDIKSQASSFIVGGHSACALNIVVRDFYYGVQLTTSNTTFTYDLSDVLDNLPAGYNIGSIIVRATGKIYNGTTVVGSSKSASGGFGIEVNRYPVTVDINVRVFTPCGDVELTHKVYLPSPISGSYRKELTVKDLGTIVPEDLTLTDHLKTIEDRLGTTVNKISRLGYVEIDGINNAVDATIQEHEVKIRDVESKVSNASAFTVKYNDLTGTQESYLSTALTDIYSEIKSLNTLLQTISAQLDKIS